MNFKNEKGSITVFVLVGLLFMTSFLIISYGNNLGKSKIVKEQTDIVRDIYATNNIIESYDQAYADLRSKNKKTLTFDGETSCKIEEGETQPYINLTKTYAEKISNYQIYGNSIQEGSPTLDNPVEIKSVGIYDEEKDAYVIPIKISNANEEKIYNIYLDEPLRSINGETDYIDFKERKVVRKNKELIFKGEEGWWIYCEANQLGNERIMLELNDIKSDRGLGLCNIGQIKRSGWDGTQMDIETDGDRIRFYRVVAVGVIDSYDVKKWKDYLKSRYEKNNPIIFAYPCKEDREEIMQELPDLNTLEDDTKIEILTEVQPTRVVLDYTGYTID